MRSSGTLLKLLSHGRAALERDLLHHVADAVDHAALHQVLRVQRVDDLAPDVAATHTLLTFTRLRLSTVTSATSAK